MLLVQFMFQIIIQEGWVEVLDGFINVIINIFVKILVVIIILVCYFFLLFIIMSVFVVVILDNLEFDEEVKIMKQKKMG